LTTLWASHLLSFFSLHTVLIEIFAVGSNSKLLHHIDSTLHNNNDYIAENNRKIFLWNLHDIITLLFCNMNIYKETLIINISDTYSAFIKATFTLLQNLLYQKWLSFIFNFRAHCTHVTLFKNFFFTKEGNRKFILVTWRYIPFWLTLHLNSKFLQRK